MSIGMSARRVAWLSAWVWLCLCSPIAIGREVIVVVKSLQADPYEDAFQGFKETIVHKGYQVDIRQDILREGEQAKADILASIADQRPRLILTLGSPATALIQRQITDVPLVFCMVLNPVDSGFIRSMQSSGNNATGASLDIPVGVQFETLKAVVPALRRVGVFYNPQETGEIVKRASKVAADLGLELIAVPVTSAEKLQESFESVKKRIDALWSVADSTVFSSDRAIEFLLRRTVEYKIPFMGLSPAFVRAGALLALSVDYKDVGMQCGEQAAQVLDGHLPASVPITAPRRVTLYLNQNVARAIGVTIPPRMADGAIILK
jgi:putative ABC transport system substrate-binding protein